MAKIIYIWELGAGWGHLSVAAPLLAELRQRGHRVTAMLRNAAGAGRFLEPIGVAYQPLPLAPPAVESAIRPLRTFAHLLNNTAFSATGQMQHNVRLLQDKFLDTDADLLLLDHCPSGLLASRGLSIGRVTIGTGFTLPPAVDAMPDWRPWLGPADEQLHRDEASLLDRVNTACAAMSLAQVDRLSDLYTEADDVLLTTYAELDHFGHRPAADYLGVWPSVSGGRPAWPCASGPKVFAYLKPSPALPLVLDALRKSNAASIVHVPALDSQQAARWQSPHLKLVAEPVDMNYAASECDFAILNGNHTTTVQMLRAGKPVLTVPLFLEQQLTGLRLEALRAGLVALGGTADVIAAKLGEMLTNHRAASGAKSFANKYAPDQAAPAIARMADRVEAVLS